MRVRASLRRSIRRSIRQVGAMPVALLLGLGGAALLVAVAACDSKPPPPKVSAADVAQHEAAAPSDVAESKNAPAASDAQPEHAAPAVAPKAPLPDDVPLYAHALPISSMSSPGRGTIVSLRSNDDADRVSGWYATEMPARGWELEKQSGAAGSHLLIAHKSGRKATVLVTANPAGTQVLLTVLDDRGAP